MRRKDIVHNIQGIVYKSYWFLTRFMINAKLYTSQVTKHVLQSTGNDFVLLLLVFR